MITWMRLPRWQPVLKSSYTPIGRETELKIRAVQVRIQLGGPFLFKCWFVRAVIETVSYAVFEWFDSVVRMASVRYNYLWFNSITLIQMLSVVELAKTQVCDTWNCERTSHRITQISPISRLFPPFLIPRYSNLFDQLSLELFVDLLAYIYTDG